ncbi:MAG: glucose-6-phosphate dehydrogenase [Chthonomonadaceae bacterium]|nr:glucose-6-phosphate dehydrogenase [Chthonomonadaceae bacterium]
MPTSPTTDTTINLSPVSLLQRPKDSSSFIIYGASGDLTKRKLIPALYNLACANLLPPDFHVIGFAVTPMDDNSFREAMKEAVKVSHEANPFNQKVWDEFAHGLHYITADFLAPEGYERLKDMLAQIEKEHENPDNRLFYLATTPTFYADIVSRLGSHNLVSRHGTTEQGWTRVIIEKPFGRDLTSAVDLNEHIHKVFKEDQIYRIDHYLGKETVQNIMAFRFANSIIEPIWNRRYIDHVQITASETLGVEHRGGYYESAGCLRDMFQNHLLQVLSIVAMDPPVRYGGTSVRDRKADVMRAIVPINPENLSETAVRGQYGPGKFEGQKVVGYRQEEGVNPESKTETFVALKLFVDNWRWAEVPFYLRSGKRMAQKVTEIVIQFKRVPHLFFQLGQEDQLEPNLLTMRIAPDEGISLRFGAKVPGPEMHLRQVQMNFSYADAFKVEPATAYETLLLDAMEGDPSLFNRADAVETAWQIVEPLIDIWSATKPFQPFPNYAAGSWGPVAADTLLAKDGRVWRNYDGAAPLISTSNVAVDHSGEPMGARRPAKENGATNGNGAEKVTVNRAMA